MHSRVSRSRKGLFHDQLVWTPLVRHQRRGAMTENNAIGSEYIIVATTLGCGAPVDLRPDPA